MTAAGKLRHMDDLSEISLGTKSKHLKSTPSSITQCEAVYMSNIGLDVFISAEQNLSEVQRCYHLTTLLLFILVGALNAINMDH